MKEIDRFNQDYAGTKFNDAYSRNLGTWNTNANAYNQNRNTIYNFLTGQSTMGQNSAAQVGTNSQQVASSVGNNITDAGNANAAASVASGNALASGLNQLSNSLRSNNGLNGAGGWNSLLSSFNIGRSGNNYNGSSGDVSAPNYANGMDLGVSF